MVIAALIFTTLVPYVLVIMDFSPLHLFHYIIVTLFILTPLGFGTLFYFTDKWECRPIEMLSFYLERRLTPPDDIMAAARVRTLNLPLVHSTTVLVRYEMICLLDCLYMGTIGGLPLAGKSAARDLRRRSGYRVFPDLLLLSDRTVPLPGPAGPCRKDQERAASTIPGSSRSIPAPGCVSIILTTVMAPLLALGALVYQPARHGTGGPPGRT